MATTEPQKFRKKPVEIEAKQYGGSPTDAMAVYQWVEQHIGSCHPACDDQETSPTGVTIDPADGMLVIRTLEGDMKATPGDWIIRGVQGEFYPCKPDIFEATYSSAIVEDETTSPGTRAFDTAEELHGYSETGYLLSGALIREADGQPWLYFEGEDGPMCVRPWNEDEEPPRRREPLRPDVAKFAEIDGLAYPVHVTVDYHAPSTEETDRA